MRKLALVVGCLAGLLFAQNAAADVYVVHFKFSKAGVTTDQFRYDRDACIGKATRTHWGSLGTWQWVDHSRSAKRFFACMKAMGYKPDPAGKFETSMPLWA